MPTKNRYRLGQTLAVLLILFSGVSKAQEHSLGLSQGVNSAYISGKLAFPETYRRYGYEIGLQYSVNIRKLHIGAEIAYIPRGFTAMTRYYDSSNNPSPEYIYYKFGYLALPLRVSYRGGRRFFGTAGVSLIPSVLIRERTYLDDDLLKPNPNGGPSKFDFGGQIEMGAGFKLNEKWTILTTLSLFRSFTRINNDRYFKGTDFRNKGVSLGLSVEYRIQ